MKGIKPVNNYKELKGGCFYFTVLVDVYKRLFIEGPFKVIGVSNKKNSIKQRWIKTGVSKNNKIEVKTKFLSDIGIPVTYACSRTFKFTTKNFMFLKNLVDNNSFKTYFDLFVPYDFKSVNDQMNEIKKDLQEIKRRWGDI